MKYKIMFKAKWDSKEENLILPKDLQCLLEDQDVKIEFFNREKK